MNIKPGTIISGRYTIIEKIGIGGMAVVYRAKDEKLDRFVTFKVLKEEYVADEDFIKKFNVEARAAARLSHPNIVNVHDVGNDGLVYYIVMEYIHGCTLKELINKKAPFDDTESLGVAIQIASALENAHKNKIIHRDIKPQNILVTKDGTIKVTDFGIARAVTSATVTTESVGSVHYFSPEQARGGFVDAKSDIYSLGIVLYEMATGRLPFDGDTAVALAMKHISEPLPDMRIINPNISKSLEQIILKATQKSSSQRYQTIEEFNIDLKRALTNSNGDFIKETDDFTNSPTVRITAEQIAQIRSHSGYENYDYPPDSEYEYNDEYDEFQEDYQEEEYSREVKYDKRKEKKVVIAAIVTAIALITLITSVGAYFINKKVDVPITAPLLEGKTWDEAKREAAEKEIYINKTGEEYDDDIEKGLIITQDIKEGQEIKKGDTINIKISLGSDKVIVPDVVNKELSEAYEELSKYNLTPDKSYINDNDVPIDVVIRQSPSSGTKVLPKDVVTLYVSKGQEITKVVVPDVTRKTEAEAKNILKAYNLVAGKISYTESNTVPKGEVIKQGVKAGEQVTTNYVVNLIISSGKPVETTTEEQEKITEQEKTTKSEKLTTEEATKKPQEEKPIITTIKEEEKQSEAKEEKTEILIVNPVMSGSEETVNVRIIKKTDSSSGEEVYNETRSISDFPLKIPVTGSRPTEFQLYIDNQLEGTEMKEFQ